MQGRTFKCCAWHSVKTICALALYRSIKTRKSRFITEKLFIQQLNNLLSSRKVLILKTTKRYTMTTRVLYRLVEFRLESKSSRVVLVSLTKNRQENLQRAFDSTRVDLGFSQKLSTRLDSTFDFRLRFRTLPGTGRGFMKIPGHSATLRRFSLL